MIEYAISFQDNINWITARNKFQTFLHRKLNLDQSSIVIEGIVSGTETWYVIKDTNGLVMNALHNMHEEDNATPEDEEKSNVVPYAVAGGSVVVILVITAAIVSSFSK